MELLFVVCGGVFWVLRYNVCLMYTLPKKKIVLGTGLHTGAGAAMKFQPDV